MKSVNAVFPIGGYADGRATRKLALSNGWGAVQMPRRFLAFMRGDPDAVPGDYLLAIVAVFGIMFAVMARALY